MRYFYRALGQSGGSLVFVAWLLLASMLLVEVCCEPGSVNLRRPLFAHSAFSSSPRQHSATHITSYSPWSPPSLLYPASLSTSAAAADMLDSSPTLPPPASTPPASSSPTPPSAVTDPRPPSPGYPFPSTSLASAPASPFSSTPYTTSVVPVRMSAAAVPLSRSAEQVAPILRGICSIPAFNPCVPLAECVPSVPVIGEATCICPPGYVGDGFVSGQGCTDINECTNGQNDCDPRTMVCIDTPGSFRCECLPGFSMAPNGRTCLDIDECQNPALNDCNLQMMVCHNLEGTYKCVCDNSQQIMDEITKQCRDLNECEDLRGIMNPCEQLCEDRIGGFRCGCQQGYRLAPNGVSCLDIDECVDPLLHACDPAGIISRCENVVGGYRCICNEALGFEDGPDGVACVNIDECIRDPYICGGALSCCKDLFPPQRFACTVPLDDVLGHTPPLGGVTAYGINAALGGSSLTNWIPGFLGVDSGGTPTFSRGLWTGGLLQPLSRIIGPGRLGIALEQEEDEKGMKWSEHGRIAEGTWDGAGDPLARENMELLRDSVNLLEEKRSSSAGNNAKDRRNREKTIEGKVVSGRDIDERKQKSGASIVECNDVQKHDAEKERAEKEMTEEIKTTKSRRLEIGRRAEKDHVEGGRRNRAHTLSIHQLTPGNVQSEMQTDTEEFVYSKHKDDDTIARQSELASSGSARGGKHHSISGLTGRGNCEAAEVGDRLKAEKWRSRGKKSAKQRGNEDGKTMEKRPPHNGEVIVIAGNSSPEKIRETLKQIVMPRNFSSGRPAESALSRRRLQLLTALKPGSPYLPGSQLGPIGGIRFGRGSTCPAGFRLGGDLYREKVRTKMKNTFEYLITSNVKTNPDGTRRIVSPQEVTTGVLSNTQLVSDEATKWYNEFVRLPSAMAPALHVGSSAAMDIGRQAALQQLLNA